MIKAKSENADAVKKRIEGLPEIYIGIVKNIAKNRAKRLVKNFHDGIMDKKLSLKRLSPNTVNQKARQGMERPDTPLWGMGDREKDSYANMMEVVTAGKRYVVRPRKKRHHTSKLKLEHLFDVHEYGAIIKGKKKAIRIPPRPAFRYAFRKLMREIKRDDEVKEVQKAISRIVRSGDKEALERIRKKYEVAGE